MKQLKIEIIENKRIAQGFYKMRLGSAYLAKNSKPGQFVEIKCSDLGEVLLRRPLGVHRILNGGIEVLYEVVGKGTKCLSARKEGEYLDIIGPLGNGFTINQQTSKPANQQTILIAGGVGVAPLVALAEKLACSVQRIACRKNPKIYVLIGAKTRNHILCEDDFKKISCEVLVSTEDGSMGYRGLITDLLNKELNQQTGKPANQKTIIYACGPAAMLKTVAKIAEAKRVPCQVSMEERMACGVGVCLGCPIKVHTTSTQYAIRNTQYTYKMVCKDGPVFNAKEIAW